MDYEKAYKAVLKTATQWINDGCTEKEKICLECVFPELRWSEDEAIRKSIVATIEQCPDDFLNPKNRDRMLAYLEKQKVTPMPNSTELIEMWHKVKAILKEKDFRGDEWRLAQNAFMDGFARGTCVKFEKQKEQKPAEWSDEDEKTIRSIRHILFEHAFENGGVDVNGDYCEDVYIQANDFLLSLRPSWKPSEEHLSALLAVFNDPNNIGSQTCQLALTDLYEQLKKL